MIEVRSSTTTGNFVVEISFSKPWITSDLLKVWEDATKCPTAFPISPAATKQYNGNSDFFKFWHGLFLVAAFCPVVEISNGLIRGVYGLLLFLADPFDVVVGVLNVGAGGFSVAFYLVPVLVE